MMNGVEAVLALFEENADEIDDGLRTRYRRRNLRLIGDVDAKRDDLADIAQGFQKQRAIRVADRDFDDASGSGKAPHQMAADKTRTAKDRDLAARQPERKCHRRPQTPGKNRPPRVSRLYKAVPRPAIWNCIGQQGPLCNIVCNMAKLGGFLRFGKANPVDFGAPSY